MRWERANLWVVAFMALWNVNDGKVQLNIGRTVSDMAFFQQMRPYFILFVLLGLWTCWPNSKYKRLLRLYSVFPVALIFLNFISTLIFKRFYSFLTLSDLIANFLFISAVLTHLIIILESIHQKRTQMELLKKFSIVNYLFLKKMRIKLFKHSEKRMICMRLLLMLIVQFVFRTFITVLGTNWRWEFDFLYVALFPEMIVGFKLIQILLFVFTMNIHLSVISKQLNRIEISTDPFRDGNVKLPVFKRILALKKIYGELHDICDRIGITFAWSLLTIILYIFINLTFNSYWVLINLTQIKNLVLNVILMAPNFIVLSAVAMYCSSSAQQVCQCQSIEKCEFTQSDYFELPIKYSNRHVALSDNFIEFLTFRKINLDKIWFGNSHCKHNINNFRFQLMDFLNWIWNCWARWVYRVFETYRISEIIRSHSHFKNFQMIVTIVTYLVILIQFAQSSKEIETIWVGSERAGWKILELLEVDKQFLDFDNETCGKTHTSTMNLLYGPMENTASNAPPI